MAKNINVKLTFSADTRAAQQQINQLQQTLSNIAATPVVGNNMKYTKAEIQEATQKAVELKVALNNATNVNTGKLNFGKFSQELKRNKMSLEQYAMAFKKLGPQGAQAFSELATAIRQSEAPLVQLQGKLAALGQTFMNTVKWSISSSMIQGVTRAFSSTIDYAKELNESLTNIRIVTGKSVADVTQFAQEANKAAKALSATTDEYAKASLIYFQQGLNDSAVAERTETTLKLAKVVGESAETTSEWMTAIWNNFDDGSRSLENYADVLAKLGAATASSADEIAGGLEKFAAVAETVGLSYEYAASALATITAETRQSEDVVGTALKTIFARVENLKLGKSLEDGTTLGQYSEALAKVGVNIKDSNGQLKEMDDILSSIGTTWQILDRDQQVALAQQVAGIRQYSQFMALMDNWDVMEDNVKMAKEANGALEEQHEIWETGIEGATSRVKEELNEIKNNLLGENDLLPLLNVAEGFLDFIGDLIDSLGGLPGLLSIIASVGLKIWGPQAATMLQNMVSNVQLLYGGLSGKTSKAQAAAITESGALASGMVMSSDEGDATASQKSKYLKEDAELTNKIEKAQNQLNSFYKEEIELLRQVLKLKQEAAIKTAEEVDKSRDNIGTEKSNVEALGNTVNANTDWDAVNLSLEQAGTYDGKIASFEEGGFGNNRQGMMKEAKGIVNTAKTMSPENTEGIEKLEKSYKKLQTQTRDYQKNQTRLNDLQKKGNKLTQEEIEEKNTLTKRQGKLNASIKATTKEFGKNAKSLSKTQQIIEENSNGNTDLAKSLNGVADNARKTAKGEADLAKQTAETDASLEELNNTIDKGSKVGQGWTTSFINGMQGVASGAAGLQMITGAFDSLTTSIADGTAGFSEYLSAITSVAFGLPMLISGLGTMAKMLKLNVVWEKLLAGIKKVSDAAEEKYLAKKLARNAKEKVSDSSNILVKWAKMLVDWPAGTLTAIALAVPVMAIIGGGIALGAISVNNKKEEKQQEEIDNKAIETAEGALEVAEGWNEESQAMDDLIDKHNKLKAANDQTIEGQKALKEAQKAIIDQVPQLIEKYKELDEEYENLSLAGDISILEGAAANKDVEQIEELTNRIDTKITEETSRLAREGQSGAAGRTLAAIAEQTGDKVKNKTIDWHVGDVGSDIGEKKLAKILGQDFDGEGVNITLDATDPKAFVEQYEKLQQFVEEMEEAGHTADDTYKEVKEGIDAAVESYEKLKKLVEDGRAYEIKEYVDDKGIDLSAIASYEKYIEVKRQLTSDTKLLKIANEEEIAAWLEANKALSTYATLEKKALALRDKYGKELYDNILREAEGLSEEDLVAFLKIDFEKFQVQEKWKELTEYIKTLDKAEEADKAATSITTGMKNLKANGTREDYEKLRDSITWGEHGFIKYSQFLTKTYAEQKAYLEGMQISAAEQAEADYKAALAKLKVLKQEYQARANNLELSEEERKQAEVDLYYAKQEIENTTILLRLAKQQIKTSKEARAEKIRTRKNNIKALQDELDVYRHINELSDDLARNMDRIAEAKDAAYGANHVALLDAEIEGLKTENKLLDQTIKLADKRAKANRQELSKKYGAEFDAFGNFSNYNEVQAQYLKSLAKLEGSQGSDSQAYKNKKDEYDDFIKLAEDYNEDLEKSEKDTDKKASNMREILDKELEGIEYTISIKLEVNEHRRNIVDRILEGLDDEAYDGAARVVQYGRQSSYYYDDVKEGAQGIRKTLKAAKVSDKDIEAYMAGENVDLTKYNLTSATIEQLDQFTKQMASGAEGLREMESAIKKEFMAGVDAWTEKISEQSALIESQGNMLSNYRNIVDLLGKNNRFGLDKTLIKEMRQASVDIANASVTTARVQKETTEAALLEATTKKNDAKKGSKEYQYWLEQEEILQKRLAEDTENFTSTWVNAINTAYEAFEEAGNEAIEELKKAILGIGGGMEDAMSMFERAGNRFISASEKAYELSKLNRTIQKQIDATDNVKAQKVWKAFQDEINEKQAAGVQMSKQDLEVMKKRYDLKLAEIALEEAQQAKSVVRLTRDSEGNYGYTYTADQNAVATAEQNYEDALYTAQKTNEDYLDNLSNQIISNRKEMIDKLAELDINDYANAEDYYAARQKIIDEYTKHENYLWKEIQKTLKNNQRIYNEDVQAFGSFVGQQGNIADAWTLDFGQTAIAIVGEYSNIEEAQKQLTTAIGDGTITGYTGTMNSAYNQLQINIDKTLGNVGTSAKGLKTTLSNAMYGEDGTKENPTGGIVGNTKDAESAASDYGKTAVKKFGDIALAVSDWYKIYKPKVEKATGKTNTLEESLASLKENYNTKVNVNTTQAQENIKNLIDAIGNIEKAIKKLKDTNFKITANVNIETGDYKDKIKEDKKHPYATTEWKNISYDNKRAKATQQNLAKFGNFEVVERSEGQSFAIYKQGDNKAIWIDNNDLNDIKFTRTNTYVREDENGKLYITAQAESSNGVVTKDEEYYIPWENVNAWGGTGWATQENLNSAFYLGQKVQMTSDTTKSRVFRPGYSIDDIVNIINSGDKNKYQTSETQVLNEELPYEQDGRQYTKILDKVYKDGIWLYKISYTDNTDYGKNYGNVYESWVPGVRLKSFDTGGYTGEWGPEGRLAMLHQKEIVLNAHDTENLLTAVSMIREISSQLESNALAMQYIGSLGKVYSAIHTGGDTLQQEVHITAEFPNATDHNEIEEAFRNLTNLASQYANRKS